MFSLKDEGGAQAHALVGSRKNIEICGLGLYKSIHIPSRTVFAGCNDAAALGGSTSGRRYAGGRKI